MERQIEIFVWVIIQISCHLLLIIIIRNFIFNYLVFLVLGLLL